MINNTKLNFPNKFSPSLAANRMMAAKSSAGSANFLVIKKAIWVYFILLIFEGALRKWVLPGLATPLLIVRDPVAIYILIQANKRRILIMNSYYLGMVIVTILAVITALLLGHGNLFVAIYGARIFLLHFPLIFIIGGVFNQEDVLKMGRVLLYMSVPMTFLIAAQFYSPQTAWINKGIGADTEGGGFEGAGGFFRPPATFSFITGTTCFYGLVSSFIFYFWFNSKLIKKSVLVAASVCLLTAVPLTISRSLFFEVALSMVFAIVIISRKPKFLVKVVPIALFAIVAMAFLGQLSMFQTATGAFTERFEGANEVEGGLHGVLIDRFLGGMVSAVSNSDGIPFFGFGIGMGTNAGSMILSGKVDYLIAEVEWGRLIGEMGIILGLTVILIRVSLCFQMIKRSYRKMVNGDTLPWMLLSFALLFVAQGQWAQPSLLGFATLSGGLVMAALNSKQEVGA